MRKIVQRKIISSERFEELLEKGFIRHDEGRRYVVTLKGEVDKKYTPDKVGKIEEKDYLLTAIQLSEFMSVIYIHTQGLDVKVDEDTNPFEYGKKFFIPEWCFEDRQKDIDNLYKRYWGE